MDLFTELTKTHNAERWYDKELAAFDSEEPEAAAVDIELLRTDSILQIGKVRIRQQV